MSINGGSSPLIQSSLLAIIEIPAYLIMVYTIRNAEYVCNLLFCKIIFVPRSTLHSMQNPYRENVKLIALSYQDHVFASCQTITT